MIKLCIFIMLILVSSCSKKGQKGEYKNHQKDNFQSDLITMDNVSSSINDILLYAKNIMDLDIVEFYTDDQCSNFLISKNKIDLENGFKLPLVELNKATNVYAIVKKDNKIISTCKFLFTFEHDNLPPNDIPIKFGNNLQYLNGLESKDSVITIEKGSLDDFGNLTETKYIIFYSDINKENELVRISLDDYTKKDFTFNSPEQLINTEYNLYIAFADSVGNIGPAFNSNVTIKQDTIGPEAPITGQDLITLSNSTTNDSNNKTISFKPAYDVVKIEVYTNGLNSDPLAFNINLSDSMSVNVPTSVNKVNEIIIRSYDKAGNYTDASYTYTHDDIPPINPNLNILTEEITFNSTESTTIQMTGLFDGSPVFYKDSLCSVEVVQKNYSYSEGRADIKLLSSNINDEGNLYWQLHDSATNKSTCLLLLPYKYDIIAPIPSFDANVLTMIANGTKNTVIQIKGDLNEEGTVSFINYSSNPSGEVSKERFQQGVNITLKSNQINDINILFKDLFGNEKVETISIKHDSLAPTLTITSDRKSYTFNTTYFIAGTADEEGTYILKTYNNVIVHSGLITDLNTGLNLDNSHVCLTNIDVDGVNDCLINIELSDKLLNKRLVSLTYNQYTNTNIHIFKTNYDNSFPSYDPELDSFLTLETGGQSYSLNNNYASFLSHGNFFNNINLTQLNTSYNYNKMLNNNKYVERGLSISNQVYSPISTLSSNQFCVNSNGESCIIQKTPADTNLVLSTTLTDENIQLGTLPTISINESDVQIGFVSSNVLIKKFKNLVGGDSNMRYLGKTNGKVILAIMNPNGNNISNCSLVAFDETLNKYAVFPPTNVNNNNINCASDITSIYFNGDIYMSLLVGDLNQKLFKTDGTRLTQVTNINNSSSDGIALTKNKYIIHGDTLFFIANKDSERLVFSVKDSNLQSEFQLIPSENPIKIEILFSLDDDLFAFDSTSKVLLQRNSSGNTHIINTQFDNITDVLVVENSTFQSHAGMIIGKKKNAEMNGVFAINKSFDGVFNVSGFLNLDANLSIDEFVKSQNNQKAMIKGTIYNPSLDKNITVLYGLNLSNYLNSGNSFLTNIFSVRQEFQNDLSSGLKQICNYGEDNFITVYEESISQVASPAIINWNFEQLTQVKSDLSSGDNLYSCANFGDGNVLFSSASSEESTGVYILDKKSQVHQIQNVNENAVTFGYFKDFSGDEFWLNLKGDVNDQLLMYKFNN